MASFLQLGQELQIPSLAELGGLIVLIVCSASGHEQVATLYRPENRISANSVWIFFTFIKLDIFYI